MASPLPDLREARVDRYRPGREAGGAARLQESTGPFATALRASGSAPRRLARLAAAVIAAALPVAALAQERAGDPLRPVIASAAVRAALDRVARAEPRAVATLMDLAAIISPSGHEHQRAAAVARRMREIGLAGVTVDSMANVWGAIPGTSGRALVFVTMLDDLPGIEALQRSGRHPPRREGHRIVGPATELQSAVAALLVGAEALVASGLRPRHDLVFAAVAREETGLLGMQALYAHFKDRTLGVVELLGDGREIQYGAGGSIAWWRVLAAGPEGHTTNRDLPNVNQAIARAVEAIFSLPHPARYRHRDTYVNIGVIQSGEQFNRKPAAGWFSLDVRSRDRAIVEAIQREIETILERVGTETGIGFRMEPDLQTWGSEIPGARDSFLTRAAVATARHLGFEPALTELGCCNMRVAIAGGTLAIGLHGARGGERGTDAEWADIPAMMTMARQVVLLAAAVGGR